MFKTRKNRKPCAQAEMVAFFESYLKMRGITNETVFWKALRKDLLELFQWKEVNRLLKTSHVMWCLIKSSVEMPKESSYNKKN